MAFLCAYDISKKIILCTRRTKVQYKIYTKTDKVSWVQYSNLEVFNSNKNEYNF